MTLDTRTDAERAYDATALSRPRDTNEAHSPLFYDLMAWVDSHFEDEGAPPAEPTLSADEETALDLLIPALERAETERIFTNLGERVAALRKQITTHYTEDGAEWRLGESFIEESTDEATFKEPQLYAFGREPIPLDVFVAELPAILALLMPFEALDAFHRAA